ncbi:MAG: hypothetical protein ACI8PZ_001608 [Myxococcota bacterium]|jgi:hypothetical protein
MRIRGPMLVLLVACSTTDAPPAPTPAPSVNLAPLPPPGSMDLAVSGFTPGALATFQVEGALPGDVVYFAASTRGFGAGPCPALLDGLCLDLVRPVTLLGSASADADGVATLYVDVPPGLPASPVYLQAATAGPPASTSDGVMLEPGAGGCVRDYVGGWPCNPDADAVPDPGFGGVLEVGGRLPRAFLEDQYGDTVDLYDLLGQDVPVLVHIGAIWAPPDASFYEWLTGGPEWVFDHPTIAPAIAAGDLQYVVIHQEDGFGGPPSGDDCRAWSDAYNGGVDVPVLADPDALFRAWGRLAFYPTTFLVGSDGTILFFDPEDPYTILPFLETRL